MKEQRNDFICLTRVEQDYTVSSTEGTFVTIETPIYIRKNSILNIWRTSRTVRYDGAEKETEIKFTRINSSWPHSQQYDVKETPEEIFNKEK